MTIPTEADRNARVEEIRGRAEALLEGDEDLHDAIAVAREDIPYLLSENARLAAELDTVFNAGIEAAAKLIEEFRDYGWENVAEAIRALAKP